MILLISTGDPSLQETWRLLPGLHRRPSGHLGAELHQESGGAGVPRVRDGGGLEGGGGGLPGVHCGGRQGERLFQEVASGIVERNGDIFSTESLV